MKRKTIQLSEEVYEELAEFKQACMRTHGVLELSWSNFMAQTLAFVKRQLELREEESQREFD